MQTYLEELKAYLSNLSQADVDDVLSYYQEYLEDAGIDTYQACIKELGTPKQVARRARADVNVNDYKEAGTTNEKSTWKYFTEIFIAMASVPVLLPLAGVLGAVVALLIAILVGLLLFSICAIAFFLICFVGLIYWAIINMGIYFNLSIVAIGAGLMLLGASMILAFCVQKIVTSFSKWIRQFSTWIYGKTINKIQGGNQ